MDDSIFMLQEEIGEDTLEDIESRGYFKTVVLIKPSQDALIRAGAANIGSNLLSFKEQFEEQIDQVLVIGVLSAKSGPDSHCISCPHNEHDAYNIHI
ncbi:MAG: hypothetical protein ACW97A_13015 [Candidatus Thorarchaeota archaeon]|jgi:hypothetical protein